nr:hypothetical protein Iba_chr04aCG3050 [Ipomoea batatas]
MLAGKLPHFLPNLKLIFADRASRVPGQMSFGDHHSRQRLNGRGRGRTDKLQENPRTMKLQIFIFVFEIFLGEWGIQHSSQCIKKPRSCPGLFLPGSRTQHDPRPGNIKLVPVGMERNEQKEGFYTDAWRSWEGGRHGRMAFWDCSLSLERKQKGFALSADVSFLHPSCLLSP